MNHEPQRLSRNPLRLIILAVVVIAAGALLYRSPIAELTHEVVNRHGSSHGVFVPFLSAFFLWTRQRTILNTRLKTSLAGIPVMAAGLAFPLFAGGAYSLQTIGYIIFLSGAITLILGWDFYKEVSFPVIFLVTLIPIPRDIYLQVAEWLRVLSFGGARAVITVLRIPFYRDGVYIHLHNALLEVAISCSGIRYLISYLVFSMAYGYLFREKFWSRVSIVIASIFISIGASVIRLSAIFILTHAVSPRMAEARPHIIISWIVFFVILVTAVSLDQRYQKKAERVNQRSEIRDQKSAKAKVKTI